MEMSYGNIFREPLTDIWQKMDGWRDGEFIPKQCHGCPIVTACRGGCRVNTLIPGLCNVDIHATPERLNNIPQERWISTYQREVSMVPSEVMVHPQVRFRNESFGALLYRSDRQAIVLVNHSAATFLKKAAVERRVFSFPSFLKHSGAITEAEQQMVERLYRKLVQKGLLITPTGQDNQL
jgi:radical SAM protein with 4Fe4S-binding SPASM domain